MNAEQAKQRYQEASRLFGEGRVADAKAILEDLAKAFPDNEQVKTALSKCRAHKPVLKGAISRWPLAIAGVAILAVVACTAYWAGTRNTRATDDDHLASGKSELSSTVMGEKSNPTPSATSGQLDEATARGTSWRTEKGTVAELVAKHGPPQSWPGEWPAFPLERKTIPNKDYPDGKCDIWVPTEEVRQAYLKQSFHATPYKGRTATEADVKKDLNQYGYYYSEYPPAHLPDLDYTEYNEVPIYPFVGQMVPGTNIQYTQPPTPPVWLIDLTPNGKTIPALTTIDPRKFRSINWPRERYEEAVRMARKGQVETTLSGTDFGVDRTVGGVVLVSGDYAHGENRQSAFTVKPGSVIVLSACSSKVNLPYGTPDRFGTNRVDVVLGGELARSIGSEQRPIIWTSDSLQPAGNDWDRVAGSLARLEFRFNLMEYGRVGITVYKDNPTRHVASNIIRYFEGDFQESEIDAHGISMWSPKTLIEKNELHNDSVGIFALGPDQVVQKNTIYNNRISNNEGDAEGIFTGQEIGHSDNRTYNDNVVVGCKIGISSEDWSDERLLFRNNAVALNTQGFSMYYDEPDEYSRPTLRSNNVWSNWLPWWNDGKGRLANFIRGHTTVGGPWIVEDEYAPMNDSYDPLFRNIRIWDLEPLAGWPEEL